VSSPEPLPPALPSNLSLTLPPGSVEHSTVKCPPLQASACFSPPTQVDVLESRQVLLTCTSFCDDVRAALTWSSKHGSGAPCTTLAGLAPPSTDPSAGHAQLHVTSATGQCTSGEASTRGVSARSSFAPGSVHGSDDALQRCHASLAEPQAAPRKGTSPSEQTRVVGTPTKNDGNGACYLPGQLLCSASRPCAWECGAAFSACLSLRCTHV
jgi:hypothetical protein